MDCSDEDWVDRLQQIKDNIAYNLDEGESETSMDNDFMSTLEDTNASLSKDTKRFKESNRYIFKQPLSYESAEQIIDTIREFQTVSEHSIGEYKKKLHKICSLIVSKGESPVEMLVYATKINQSNTDLINIVLDELKDMNILDNKLNSSYKNILRSWNWQEQIKLVVQSIKQMKLQGFGEELLSLFESNIYLREEAAYAIVDIGYEQYYDNIINLLLAIKDDSKDTSDMIYRVLSRMCKCSQYTIERIFKIYMENSFSKMLNSALIGIIRKNVTPNILKQLEKNAICDNANYQRKTLFLLAKIKNAGSKSILNSLKKSDKVDLKFLTIALGYSRDENNLEFFKKIIEDESRKVKERTSAIISLATIRDNSQIPYIEKYLNKSPEFEIAAASALVELGDSKRIQNLFRYILQDVSDEYLRNATGQINRLRGLKIDSINNGLISVFEKLVQRKDEKIVLRIINLFTASRIDERIAKIFVREFRNTSNEQAKIQIMDYLVKNFGALNNGLKVEVRNILVESSNENFSEIKQKSMENLKIITRQEDLVPVING